MASWRNSKRPRVVSAHLERLMCCVKVVSLHSQGRHFRVVFCLMAFESRGAWNARKSERGACVWTAVAASVAPKSLAALTEFSLSVASRWSSFGIPMSRRTGQSPTPHTISSVTACRSTEESVPVSQRTHMLHAASMMRQPVRVCECAEPSPEPPMRVEGRRESACCGQRSYTLARFSRSRRRSCRCRNPGAE